MNNKVKTTYRLASTLLSALSLLPLWLLYRISDILFYIIYYIVRYRRQLVRKNLIDSFPNKTMKEIKSIERGYYSWFCDYIVETVKLLTMSEDEMSRRMKFVGVEQAERYFNEGYSCAMYLGHYCNWEWITSLPLHLKNGLCAQIYHPLENKSMDTLFLRLRNRFGAVSIEMDETFRTIMTWKKEGRVNIVGYIADQVPGLNNVHCWVDFLNHDTPVFTGAERINRLSEAKIFYGDVSRPKRGYYVCRFVEIPLPPEGYVKFHYTKTYFKMLEATINRAPQYWLWSHNRWKRTREQFNEKFTEEERRRMLNRL